MITKEILRKGYTRECHRCCERSQKGKGSHVLFKMSWFNCDYLCKDCHKEEENHPDIEIAKEIEGQYVKMGVYNYPGIGWPGKDGRVNEELIDAIKDETNPFSPFNPDFIPTQFTINNAILNAQNPTKEWTIE